MQRVRYGLILLCLFSGLLGAGTGKAAGGNSGLHVGCPVKLSSVSPAAAPAAETLNVTMTGENFHCGTVPVLRQPGQPDVTAAFVNVISPTRLACRFDLSDAATGYWNVTVPSANGDAVLENGFRVFYPPVAVRAISRGRAYRLGIDTPGGIAVLDIPAGAFAEDCVVLLCEPSALHDGFVCSGGAAEYVNDKDLEPQKDITLTFYYDLSGRPDVDRRAE